MCIRDRSQRLLSHLFRIRHRIRRPLPVHSYILFCDEFGKDEKEVFEIMEAFGFGMGTMGTCGAVSAMAAVAGMKESDGNLDKPGTKKASRCV